MADPLLVSPTGTPVIPPRYVPILAAVPVVLVALSKAVPAHTLFGQWGGALATLIGTLLGMASPGLRK